MGGAAAQKNRERLAAALALLVSVAALWLAFAPPATAGDDYPYPNQDPNAVSPMGFNYRNCTDFVAWRLNEHLGTTAMPYAFSWWTFVGSSGDGNAIGWKQDALNHGFLVDAKPQVGSVAWWGNAPFGHVAMVTAVNGDGSVNVEEYNATKAYGWDVRQGLRAEAYLHIADTPSLGTRVPGGTSIRVHVSSSGGATVLGTLTVVNPDGPGYTTAYPCNATRPLASNSNYLPGQTVANFTAVATDQNGDMCIYTQADADLIWDQVSQTTAIAASNPTRILDTRVSGRVGAGQSVRVHVSSAAGATVLGNLTVVNPDGPGYTTAYPCSVALPLASNSNYLPGQTVANFAAVASDGNGDICLYTQADADLIWDQVSQTTAIAAGAPNRVIDTRNGGRVGVGGTLRIHTSSTAGATVLGNLTVVNPDGPGYVTAYPCSTAQPQASNANYTTSQTVATFAAVASDQSGDICVYTQAGADLIWDQISQSAAIAARSPIRLLDTRWG